MVLTSKLTFAAALSALVTTVAAQQQTFKVFQPSANWWWVAESENTMSWDCKSSPVQLFTIFITNSNPSVLSGRLAFIAEQPNDACSQLISKDQINQAPATGYQLQFADTINSSLIYATSDTFEIKALGSTYPTSSVGSGSSSATGTGSGSAATSTSKSHSGASSVKTSMGLGLAAIGVLLGFMTA